MNIMQHGKWSNRNYGKCNLWLKKLSDESQGCQEIFQYTVLLSLFQNLKLISAIFKLSIFSNFSVVILLSIISIIEFKKKMLFSKSEIHYFLICRLTFSPSKNLKLDIPYFLIIFIRTIIKHFCQNSQSGILLTRKRDELGINFGLR